MNNNLKIVTVAPITKTIFNEGLTYFTTKDISLGALVTIPLKNKEVLGIITSIDEAKDLKSELKTSEFNFKKIKRVLTNKVYLRDFIDTAKETAEYFASSTGQIIRLMTPKVILENWKKYNFDPEEVSLEEPVNLSNKRFEISVLGLPDEERYSFYKSLIREEFAKKHSVFFILPTIHDTEECGEILKKGIEGYTIIMHSRTGAKTIKENWQIALREKHPILLVTTSAFLSLPKENIATIIIDKSNSQFYKTMSRPFIDIRKFAEKLAEKKSARLILGDAIPRIEDIYAAKVGTFVQELPLKYRFPKDIYQELIDMRKGSGEKAVLSPKVKQAIKDSVDKKEHALIVCARKGLGTSTVCGDCGEIIICTNCSLPMVLEKTKKENIFFCNRCGKKSSTNVSCTKCKGWKLKVLGITTEKVEEEIKSIFPEIKIFRVDSNTAKNYKQARIIINEFLETPGSLLLGTEMVLTYLNREVETVVIASIDTLFSIPDYKINENIFNFLTRLRLKTSKRFLIQTRKPEEKIFKNILNGDLLEFYREEIKERKRFNYPPFRVLVKITAEGPREITNKEMTELERFLSKYEPNKFNAFIERTNNEERINILLRVDPKKWPLDTTLDKPTDESARAPYTNLLEILKSLPKRFVVRVDPDNIL